MEHGAWAPDATNEATNDARDGDRDDAATDAMTDAPPLQALVVFEAAARHRNFTAAAQELGTTQPAVSHRVRGLEERLGLALFRRQARGVDLTEAGQQLFDSVHASLDQLRQAMTALQRRHARRPLTLATDPGLARLWLMPRLEALRTAVPGLQLRILTAQHEIEADGRPADLSLHFGPPPEGGRAELMFPEQVLPVCSPGLLQRLGPVQDPADLADWPLLTLQHPQDGGPERWMSWRAWFEAQGRRPPMTAPAWVFNDYALLVQAAQAGQGVALGWAPLVDDLIARGELVVPVPVPVRTARGYWLEAPARAPVAGRLAQVLDWLLEAAAERHRPAVFRPVVAPPGPVRAG